MKILEVINQYAYIAYLGFGFVVLIILIKIISSLIKATNQIKLLKHEGNNINQSLTALKERSTILSKSYKESFVPLVKIMLILTVIKNSLSFKKDVRTYKKRNKAINRLWSLR